MSLKVAVLTIVVVMVVVAAEAEEVHASESRLELFVHQLKLEIMKVESRCTDLVPTFDVSTNSAISTDGGLAILEGTYYGVDLLANSSVQGARFIPAATLHYRPCSLLLFDLSSALQRGDNVSLNFNHWPMTPYAGSPHAAYYFFIIRQPSEIPDMEELLIEFAKSTQKILHAFFVLLQPDDVFDVFGRNAFGTALTHRSTFRDFFDSESFLIEKLDFLGEPMVATVCPICASSLDDYRADGTWHDYLTASMYELSLYANATLEPTAAFGAPQTGLTLEGTWDEFVMPLVDGSAVITQLIEPSVKNLEAIYPSSPMFFDNVAFITDHPKRQRYTSLSALISPLNLLVWIGIGLSYVFVFIALEIIIDTSRTMRIERKAHAVRRMSFSFLSSLERSIIRESEPEHRQQWTLFALFISALDQVPLTAGPFARSIRGSASRLLISLWYLMLITIGCAYKSDLTSAIVRPVYIRPPETFKELVESDYKIGAIFYTGNLEDSFKAFNTSMSRAVQARVYQYDFLEPDCYVSILKERAVCIGTVLSIPSLSKQFLVDIWGRPMYLFSKERIFPLIMTFGLSRLYPSLLTPLNNIVGWFTCTGLYHHWSSISERRMMREGQLAARKSVTRNKVNSGEDAGQGSEAISKVTLYVQVLTIGYVASCMLFTYELLARLFTCLKSNRFVVTNDFLRGPFTRVLR